MSHSNPKVWRVMVRPALLLITAFFWLFSATQADANQRGAILFVNTG